MPLKILTFLRREGFNATRVYDAGLRSQPDTAIFAHAHAYHMSIITFDTDYLNQTAFPPPHAGIIVLRSFPRGCNGYLDHPFKNGLCWLLSTSVLVFDVLSLVEASFLVKAHDKDEQST